MVATFILFNLCLALWTLSDVFLPYIFAEFLFLHFVATFGEVERKSAEEAERLITFVTKSFAARVYFLEGLICESTAVRLRTSFRIRIFVN